MEVKKIGILTSYLEIDKRRIKNVFGFELSLEAQRLEMIAEITLARDVIVKHNIKISKNEPVSIFVCRDMEDKQCIFEGKIIESRDSDGNLCIVAIHEAYNLKNANQSFSNSTLEDVLKEYIPNLEYRSGDNKKRFHVVKGGCVEHVLSLLEGKQFYINLEGKLVVTDKRNQDKKKKYKLDAWHCTINNHEWEIFPIPEIMINDIVEHGENKKQVSGIEYRCLDEVKMVLKIVDCK